MSKKAQVSLDFFRNSIRLPTLPFLASLSENFSTKASFKRSLFFALLLASIQAVALPEGPAIVSGSASFNATDPKVLEIGLSDRAIIDWQSFSIENGELTHFVQPSPHSSVLNRVVTDAPSQIFGALEANGKVFLVNPNGIFVAESGVIDVGSFFASTLDVLNDSFLAGGDLLFKGDSKAGIVQVGQIRALDGDVALMARFVENKGSVNAPKGRIGIAAGGEILLSVSGEQHFYICPETEVEPSGTGILNEGALEAVAIELKANGNPYALAIRHKGDARAKGLEIRGGRIFVVAEQGISEISGSVIAERGGEVQVIADAIHLKDGALIDASGDHGGGTVFIGGGEKGVNPPLYEAKQLVADSDTMIKANALIDGNGGKVIAWASNSNRYLGKIEAKGGTLWGDGGFVEISSPGVLNFHASVETLAPRGRIGTLLLDPTDITLDNNPTSGNISFGGGCGVDTYCPTGGAAANILISDILTQLNTTNVIINSSPGGGGALGDITIANSITYSGAEVGALTLNASHDIFINSAVQANGSSGNLTFNASRNLELNASFINNSTTAAVAFNAGTGMASGNLTVGAGATYQMNLVVTQPTDFNAFGDILIQGDIFNNGPTSSINITAGAFGGAGTATIDSTASIFYTGTTTANLNITANSGMSGNTDITVLGSIGINQGGLNLSTPNDISIQSTVTVTGPIAVYGVNPANRCGTLWIDGSMNASGVNASLQNNLLTADNSILAQNLTLLACTLPNNSNTSLNCTGNLTIDLSGDLTETAGLGPMLGSSASLGCLGAGKTLTITAANITLQGGSTVNSAAVIQSNNNAIITTVANGMTPSGNLNLLGATGPVIFGTGNNLTFNIGGDLNLIAGAASNGGVILIANGLFNINFDGALNMSGGWVTEIASIGPLNIIGSGTYAQGIQPGSVNLIPSTDGAAIIVIDGSATLSMSIPGDLNISGSSGAPVVPVAGIFGPFTMTSSAILDLTIGGNVTVTGGSGAGYSGYIGSVQMAGIPGGDCQVLMTALGMQGITLDGGSAASASALIGTLGGSVASSVSLSAPNGSITLNGSSAPVVGANAQIMSNGGAINLAAHQNIILAGTSNNTADILVNPFMAGVAGTVTALAGNNMTLNDFASISSTQDIVLATAQNISSPGIGTSLFSTGAGSSISANGNMGNIQIFGTTPAYVSILGTLNGVAFVPGPSGVDTDQEHYNVYYPNAFVNPNPPFFTVFYRAASIPNPPTPPTPGEIVQTVDFYNTVQRGMQEFLTDLQAYLDFDFFNFSELFFKIVLEDHFIRGMKLAPFPAGSLFANKESEVSMFRREYVNYNLRRINSLK